MFTSSLLVAVSGGLLACGGAESSKAAGRDDGGGGGIEGDAGPSPSPSDGGAPEDSSSRCANDFTCRPGYVCGFPTGDMCVAEGNCIALAAGAPCGAEVLACACDGTTVGIPCGYPASYAPEPIAYLGGCDDGGTPGGPIVYLDGGGPIVFLDGSVFLDDGGSSADSATGAPPPPDDGGPSAGDGG